MDRVFALFLSGDNDGGPSGTGPARLLRAGLTLGGGLLAVPAL